MGYFKINFQNKSVGSSRTDKTSEIKGEMIFKYIIEDNKLSIHNGMLLIGDGSQFNEHQQSTWTTKKGYRKSFSEKFNKIFNNSVKNIRMMNQGEIKWWNQLFEENKISLLNVSKFLTGNNPTGSQQNKTNSEFLISEGKLSGKPFFNLLKCFSVKQHIKSVKFSEKNISDAIEFDEFLEIAKQINVNIKEVIDNFFSPQKYFYIDEARELLGMEQENTVQRLRTVFRNNLINMYERKDQLYKVFTARKMVEAAHIKPVSHNATSKEIMDVENGILLSPDIHKLFDSGAITFNDLGGVVYTTNKQKEPYNISKKEVNRLELDNYKLDKKLLTENRLKYLKYHRKNVYLKGV